MDHVELIDCMGNDKTVVNAARLSFNKSSDSLDEKDIRLIHYLAENGHWSPFSHPQLQFKLTMPIAIARQWFKTRIGIASSDDVDFSINEVSRRYVSSGPECYIPDVFREAIDNVKQGSGGPLPHNEDARFLYEEAVNSAILSYRVLLAAGVCPEQARFVLPMCTMTTFIQTGSLYAFARICKLRLDKHAQREIQLYGESIAKHLKALFPVSWDALSNMITF